MDARDDERGLRVRVSDGGGARGVVFAAWCIPPGGLVAA